MSEHDGRFDASAMAEQLSLMVIHADETANHVLAAKLEEARLCFVEVFGLV